MLLSLSGCNDCSLQKEWQWLSHPQIPVIPPELQGFETILGIGEGPGENEDREGSVFVGSTGRLLRDTIPDPWKKRIHWANTIRCRPPNNRAPTPQEICCCSEYLERDLGLIKPHAILAVGGVALDYFWPGMGITAARGVPFPVQSQDGTWIWCYAVFHPSYVARGVRKDNVNTVLPVFRTDLVKFFNQVPRFLTPPSPPRIPESSEVCYPKTLEEAKCLFERLKPPFGYDIETSKLKPYQRDARIVTAAFSDGTTHIAFPVDWPGILYNWGHEALGWCLEKNRAFIAHNAPFELCWSWYHYPGCDLEVPYEDSMAKARVKYERKTLLSLDDQTKIHVGKPIKEVTQVDSSKILSYPLEKVLYYNVLDAWGSWVIHNSIQLTPVQQSNYDRIINVHRSTVTMELLGLPVDLEESNKLEIELKKKQEDMQAEAQNLPEIQRFTKEYNKSFSLSGNKDISTILVKYCNLSLPKTEAGNYSSAEDALHEFRGNDVVDAVLDYREVAKLYSTYVKSIQNGSMLGVDGLPHPSYNACLVATGRLQSQDPNIQNWPKRRHREVRRQIKVPPGYILVSADYGQVEARTVAMAARDKGLIQSFVNKIDIHTKWLTRLVELYPDYLSVIMSRRLKTKDEKKLWKGARQAIKTDWVFASIYGAKAPSTAHNTGIPLKICEDLLKEFWAEYSNVQKWIESQFTYYMENGCVTFLTGMVRNEVMNGNEYINSQAQGVGTGHIPLEAQYALWKKALVEKDFSYFPRANVHDDLTFILPDDSDLDRKIDIIAKEMVVPRFSWSTCPLTAEVSVGYNWCDLEEVGVWTGDYIKL